MRAHGLRGQAAAVVAGLLSIAAGRPAVAVIDTTVPRASFTTSGSITGSVIARFDETVRGVGEQNVIMVLTGTQTKIGLGLTCYTGGGARTDCSLGDVRKVVAAYDRPLLPGQRYTVVVNPDGAPPIVDAAGNSVAKTLDRFRAGLSHQEWSVAARFLWDRKGAGAAYGDSYRRERARGAKAIYRFTGTSVTWYTVKGPRQGTASVYIDGVRRAVVNNYADDARYRVARRFGGLSDRAHRLTIKVRGERGSSSGRDTFVAVDSFAVEGERDTGAQMEYRWAIVRNDGASGDSYARSDVPGASASFRFRGKGLDWYTVRGPKQGKAAVYLDGERVRTVDNYASSADYRVRVGLAGLSDRVHKASVVVLRENDRRSAGRRIAVDRWLVRIPSIAMFDRLGAWVDLFDTSLDPAAAVAKMDERGVRTIYVQTARYSSDADIAQPEWLGEWIDAAHDAGIAVVGWYLPAYDQYLDRDVRRTNAAADFRSPAGRRLDAIAVDIEFKGKVESLEEFNDGIRAHLRRVRAHVGNAYPIGGITPAPLGMAISPSSWEGFPWGSIGRYSDVVLPMAYWSYRHDCPEEPDHCAEGYGRENTRKARAKSGLPVHVIGGVGNEVSESEVGDFVDGARAGDAIGGSLYDYRTTASSFWNELAGLNDLTV